jgi:hypothetical protein
MAKPQAILSYTPPQPRRWFARRRTIGFLLLLAFVIAPAAYFGRDYLHQAGYLLKQRRAMTHQRPRDFVAFESDPNAAAILLKRTEYRPVLVPPFPTGRVPSDWKSPAFYHPRFLDELVSTKPDGTLFVHARHNPAGEMRLVLVRLIYRDAGGLPIGINPDVLLQIRSEVLTPASWRPGSKLHKPASASTSQHFEVSQNDNLKFYAGQPDPNDATHFTIDYSLAGQRGVIDGYVRPARADERALGDRVDLLVRDGPLWGRMDSTPTRGREAPPP